MFFSERDPDYLRFIEQMATAGQIALQKGERISNGRRQRYQAKSGIGNPTDFYVCEIEVDNKPDIESRHPTIELARFLPSQSRTNLTRPYQHHVIVQVECSGLITLRLNPESTPGFDYFEEPTGNERFQGPGIITKAQFKEDHFLIRGPITSLGAKTRDYLFGFVDNSLNEILKKPTLNS